MKKNRIIAVLTLITLLIALFAACSSNANMASGDGTNTDPSTTAPSNAPTNPEDNTSTNITNPTIPSSGSAGSTDMDIVDTTPYEPVFLIASTLDTSEVLHSQFEKAEDYGLLVFQMWEILPDLQNSTIKNPLGGQELKYAYSKCAYTSEETKEIGKHYSAYDFYSTENEDIGVLHGTELVCFYFNRQNGQNGQLWPEKADPEEIAASFLTNMIGNKIFSEFECTYAERDTTGLYYYTVHFARTTNGYQTDEVITVYLDKSGTVAAYNGYNLCKYDSLKGKFNAGRIKQAADTLTNKLSTYALKDMEVSDPIITANLDGELFLQVYVTYKDNKGFARKETVFINV